MSNTKLRKSLIRLAHQKPELRPVLLPLLTKQAVSLPHATRRPAGKKFRSEVWAWGYTEIRNKLGPSGANLSRDNITSAVDVLENAVRKPKYGGYEPLFNTQVEIINWVTGKTKVPKNKLRGMGGFSKWGRSFSFPDVIDAYIARYGAETTSGLIDQLKALAKSLNLSQLGIASAIYAPSSYGDAFVIRQEIESGMDEDEAIMWIHILEWVAKHSDYPPTRFNQR